VIIADDQHLFAESLKFVLRGESAGRIDVLGIAENGQDAVEMVEVREPDIVLMDIRMPVMDGVEATEIIHKNNPSVKTIILTTFDDDELAVSALSCGATGYVLKDVDPQDLIQCIEAVYKGAYYISPSVGIKLFESKQAAEKEVQEDMESAVRGYLKQLPNLSRRECEILYYVAQAQSNKEIAGILNISDKTVKNHLNAIYSKLNIHNRLQLINRILSVTASVRKTH
jgi:DNA-binding NarL/FixJ family response regulator